MVLGATIGIFAAIRVKMTAMPQMVALYNGAGGGAAAMIGVVEYVVFLRSGGAALDPVISVSLVVSMIIGAVSFAGSIIAFLKLQELMTGDPITYPGQQVVNAIIALGIIALGVWFIVSGGTLPLWGFALLLAGGTRTRRAVRAADRRRRHAGRDLAAQLVHRSRRRNCGL